MIRPLTDEEKEMIRDLDAHMNSDIAIACLLAHERLDRIEKLIMDVLKSQESMDS